MCIHCHCLVNWWPCPLYLCFYSGPGQSEIVANFPVTYCVCFPWELIGGRTGFWAMIGVKIDLLSVVRVFVCRPGFPGDITDISFWFSIDVLSFKFLMFL